MGSPHDQQNNKQAIVWAIYDKLVELVTGSSGTATAANQVLEIAKLTSIDSKTPTLGQALMSGSVPVVIASNQSTLDVNFVGGATTANQVIQSSYLANIQAGVGATTDLEASGDGSTIAILKRLRTLIGGTLTISGSVTANAGTNLNTSLLALESGGNLASIVTQTIAINTVLGAQADASAGSDTGTFSITALVKRLLAKLQSWVGIAGFPSTNVLSVQGVTSGTVLPTSDSTLQGKFSDTLVVSITGKSTIQTNMLTGNVSSSDWYDANAYVGGSLSVNFFASVSSGVITFEETDDTVNLSGGSTKQAYNTTLTTGATQSTWTVTTAGVSLIMPITHRYIRFRITTTVSAGIVGATTVFTRNPFAFMLGVNANLSLIGGGTVTTYSATDSSKPLGTFLMAPGAITVVSSAARTTTGNSGTISSVISVTLTYIVNVTATSGTPTMDLVLQESPDGGTNWIDIWHVERITATTTIVTPPITTYNTRRWVWTIGGSSPSLTFSISACTANLVAPKSHQYFDRTANILNATLNAVTGTYQIGGTPLVMALIDSGAAAAAGTYQLQMSLNNSTWYNASAATLSVANTVTPILQTAGVMGKYARIICTAGGTTQTLNYVAIIAFQQ